MTENVQERFNRVQEHMEVAQQRYNATQGKYESQKEDYEAKRAELKEAGIEYSGGKELQEIYLEKDKRINELLGNMETILGLDGEVEDDTFDF